MQWTAIDPFGITYTASSPVEFNQLMLGWVGVPAERVLIEAIEQWLASH